MITTGDHKTIKIWNYLSKSCIQTVEGHTSNVPFAVYHPTLPIIVSGPKDGTVKIWHANTYRLENRLNYALERGWCVVLHRETNEVAVGFDDVVVLKLGRTSRRTLWTLLANSFTPAEARCSHSLFKLPRRMRRPKAHAFRYHRANLGQHRYTPMPSYIPIMGCSSLSSEMKNISSIVLSRGETRRLDQGTVSPGPTIQIRMPCRKAS